MRKNALALGVAAALMGVAGTASAGIVANAGETRAGVVPAQFLTAAQNGMGHINIIPYYTSQAGFYSTINIVNTDTLNGKALKVRFRSAINSDDVFDFQVLMSPGDMWTAAVTEGARALSYWVGYHLDLAEKHPDANVRQAADDLVALMTPIIKSYQTDMGFEVASTAMQIHGGHGYIWDYGVEQYARDARIAMIYEGTNGIQALDLVGRKMGEGYGRLLRRFFHPVTAFIEQNQEDPRMGEFIFPLAKSVAKLQQLTAGVAMKGLKDPNEAGAASSDYLRMFALVAVGYMWALMAKTALEKMESGADGRDEFYDSKIKTARFYFARMLPDTEAHFRKAMAGADSLMELQASGF